MCATYEKWAKVVTPDNLIDIKLVMTYLRQCLYEILKSTLSAVSWANTTVGILVQHKLNEVIRVNIFVVSYKTRYYYSALDTIQINIVHFKPELSCIDEFHNYHYIVMERLPSD